MSGIPGGTTVIETLRSRAMFTPTRFALLAATLFLALAVACGGDGDGASGNSEDDVRRDVTNAINALLGDEPDLAEFAKHSPEECPADLGELALGMAFLQAFIGDVEIEFEVTDVELLENDRALATLTGSGDFIEAFAGGDDSEPELLVLQEGRWRLTSDCEDFNDERAELGLDTTDSVDDFGGGFGDDFGPPVDASVGDLLEVGNLAVTILGASLSSEALDDFSDAPQGVFVVVDFIFENDGQEPTSPWWALKMSLFDDRDRTWETDGLPFEDVGPGFSQEFQVAWDVPLDATGFRVVVSADSFVDDLGLPDDFAPYAVPLGDVR